MTPRTSRRILVLVAHPILERSRVNRRLLAAVEDLEGLTVHDLYEAYPDLAIDVAREQQLLVEHDVIVFQHPFYWYSVPAILKEWQDLVLEHGWAYGTRGHALEGKITLNALSTGGPAAAYRREGPNRFTVRELLAPWDQTAHLCGMRFLAPFVVHSALRIESDDDVREACESYRRVLTALRDDTIDLAVAARAQVIAEALGSPAPLRGSETSPDGSVPGSGGE
jgi:glutathione-regulated potassium-efflux system ancillary protein KefG